METENIKKGLAEVRRQLRPLLGAEVRRYREILRSLESVSGDLNLAQRIESDGAVYMVRSLRERKDKLKQELCACAWVLERLSSGFMFMDQDGSIRNICAWDGDRRKRMERLEFEEEYQ